MQMKMSINNLPGYRIWGLKLFELKKSYIDFEISVLLENSMPFWQSNFSKWSFTCSQTCKKLDGLGAGLFSSIYLFGCLWVMKIYNFMTFNQGKLF